MKNEIINQLYFPKLNEEIIIGNKKYICHSVDFKTVGMDACMQCDIDRDAKNTPCPEIECITGDYFLFLKAFSKKSNSSRSMGWMNCD